MLESYYLEHERLFTFRIYEISHRFIKGRVRINIGQPDLCDLSLKRNIDFAYLTCENCIKKITHFRVPHFLHMSHLCILMIHRTFKRLLLKIKK